MAVATKGVFSDYPFMAADAEQATRLLAFVHGQLPIPWHLTRLPYSAQIYVVFSFHFRSSGIMTPPTAFPRVIISTYPSVFKLHMPAMEK